MKGPSAHNGVGEHLLRRLRAGQSGDTLATPIPWRTPPVLEGLSVGARLLRGVFDNGMDAISCFMLRSELLSLSSEGRDTLFEDYLLLSINDTVLKSKVNLRNTQFVSADRACLPFQFGYELETLALIDAFVPDNGHFLDIGANFGYFGLYLGGRKNFQGRIICFEPAKEPYQDMIKLVAEAKLDKLVQGHNVGLSNCSGSAILTDEAMSGSAKINHAATGQKIDLMRLDDMAIDCAHLIKLDVEFHEAEVIEGGLTFIQEHKPVIVFEMHRQQDEEAYWRPIRLLESLDYDFATPSAQPVFEADHAEPSLIRLCLTLGGPPGPNIGADFYNMLAFPKS